MADGPLIWIKAFSNSYLLPVFSAIHGSSWLLSRKTFYFHVQAASPTSSQDTKSASRFSDLIRSAACRHPSEKLSNSFWLRVMVKSFKWIGSLSVLVLSSLPPKFDLIFSIFRYVLWQPLLWTCFTSFCISWSKMFSKSSNIISLHLNRISPPWYSVLFYLTITVAIVFLGCVFEIQGKSDKYPTVSSEGKPPPTPGKTFARFLSWLIFGDKMGFPV